MNKTAILSFILDEVALKCRNVSTNMRKRIHWMLKYMEITVEEYDERLLILNGLVKEGKYGTVVLKVEEMKKGLSNYWLKTQEQLDKLITLNNEIRCDKLEFNPTAPIEVESIEDLAIHQDNYEIYSKCSFNTVKYLFLKNLSTDQIKLILTRCKRINRLYIVNSSLQTIDFTQPRIRKFCFDSISFKEPIYLPREIEELELTECKSPNLINAQKVNKIDFSSRKNDPKEYVELTKTLRGVKVAEISDSLGQYLTYMPSTIRKIDGLYSIEDNLVRLTNKFPYLIEVAELFPIKPTDKSKIRAIEPKLEETEEKFNLRPRRIRVDYYNVRQLNNHPELFEKVEWIYIWSNEFNLDVLPSEIKKIDLYDKVDLESVTLNRLKKERE